MWRLKYIKVQKGDIILGFLQIMISSFRNLIDRGLVGSSQISKTLSFNLETQQSTFRSNMIHQINTNQKQHEMKVNGEFCDGRSLARLLGNGEGGLAEEGVMR